MSRVTGTAFRRALAGIALGLTLLVGAAGLPGHAQQAAAPSPEALAVAAELLGVLGTEKQFEAVIPLIMQQFRQVIVQSNPSAAKGVDEVMPQLIKKFSARKGDVVPMVAQIYARRLTIDDMKAMITFFKSPAGVRFVETTPQLTQEGMMVGQQWGQKLGQEVEQELRQELIKRGIKI